MAVQAWTSMSILVGPLEVATHSKSFSAPQVSAAELDMTSLADTWRRVKGGKKSISWSATVMNDFADDSLDETFHAALGVVDQPVSLLPAGTTSGAVGWAFPALELGYTPFNTAHGELAMGELSGAGTGVAVRGTLMHPPATSRTSSSTGTAYELGAITATQRMYCSAHVTFHSGTSEALILKLQSSATEGGSYTDRITFTTVSDALGSEWKSVIGAVTDTWWRAAWTISGSGSPTFQFAMVAGIGAAA